MDVKQLQRKRSNLNNEVILNSEGKKTNNQKSLSSSLGNRKGGKSLRKAKPANVAVVTITHILC